ncbi:hypothetical protein P5673_004466 [Acropora cervicornis]|uniref:Uncharacterized protein n=1 Tax=Acropora cervicornis TaxID=6130 RepID=A0AAD9R0B6_ACRCE|nr:hypothetical protein P5673_004466 [Acropora cervicornis]
MVCGYPEYQRTSDNSGHTPDAVFCMLTVTGEVPFGPKRDEISVCKGATAYMDEIRLIFAWAD